LKKTIAFALLMATTGVPGLASSIAAPDLGSSVSFGLLAGTISNTGASVVIGNVGAMTSITGFPPGIATGGVTLAGPVVTAAFDDFVTAYNFAFSDSETPPTQTVAGGLTENQTFIGNNVYSFSSADVTSAAGDVLTFDAQGNGSDIFILKDIGALTVNGPITFDLAGGAQAKNIYWIVGGSATINPTGVPVIFDGSILAGTSVTVSAGPGGSGVLAGTINGCVFAESGTATSAGETDINGCNPSGTAVSVPEPDATTGAPEPGAAGLMAIGGLLVIFRVRRARRVQRESSLGPPERD
jgi:hypothetical protein